MPQSLKGMMVRVSSGVSKASAANTENAWIAIRYADMSESGVVKLSAKSYATVYKYLEACAAKCGLST